MYIYPDNLSAKAMLFLWELRSIAALGVGCLLSVFVLARLGVLLPLVLTAVYGFLTIRFDGESILDYIRYACAYFFTTPQLYTWRAL